jgi:plasmid stability protein
MGELLVRMPVALHAQLKDRAATEDRSMAATVRHALRLYLARPPAPGAKEPRCEAQEARRG